MSASDLSVFPGSPGLSALLFVILASALLYFAREPMHCALRALSLGLHQALRMVAQWVMQAETRFAARNRQVALAAGRRRAVRSLEFEFERMEAAAQRDLSDYPLLHRRMSDALQRIESDYLAGAEGPPVPTDWVSAVEAVARLPAARESVVAEVLRDIQAGLDRSQHEALMAYRDVTARRQRVLHRALPHWRALRRTLERVDGNLERLLERAQSVERHVGEYRALVRGEDQVLANLSSSSLSRTLVAGLLLAVMAAIAALNFGLVAAPLQTLIDAHPLLGFEMAQVTALTVLSAEVAMGVVLMESLRITRLFPALGSLEHRLRRRIVWIAIALLTGLASVEAGLVHLGAASSAELSAAIEPFSIAVLARMGLGFTLPLALAFLAVPLESFVEGARSASGGVGLVLLRSLGLALRLGGRLARSGGRVAVQIYDLLIFVPLWLERRPKRAGGPEPSGPEDSSAPVADAPVSLRPGKAVVRS